MKRLLFLLSFNLFFAGAFAQYGAISGSVKEAKTQEGVIGAAVRLDSLQEGTVTDVNGNFEIKKVPTGLHSLTITFVGMTPKTIPRIRVEADKVSSVNTELEDDNHTLETVVVKGQRLTNTEVSVVSEVKQLPQIAVGIAGQLIQKMQDRDAAGVVRRIPGVSIFDDRFVVVRGLNERYNTVMLNDIVTPSTEVDSKAFSFDMIPSSAIDRMLVFKSASADLPGDISGGAIKIYTKTIPDGNTSSLSLLLSHRHGTTFKNFDSYQGSKTDWLGFDNGLRQLPSRFPSYERMAANAKSEETIKYFRNLPDYYNIKNESTLPDLRLNYNISHRWFMGGKELTHISYLAYTKTSQGFQLQQKRFNFNGAAVSGFEDASFNENVRAGIMSNWALILNPKNKIECRNLFNQLGIKETVFRKNGFNESGDFDGGSFRYEQRSIYSGQFNGTHELSEKFRLKWTGGFGYTGRLEPDYRRYTRNKLDGTENKYIMAVPLSNNASLQQAARSYSELGETMTTFRADAERKFKIEADEKQPPKISFGAYLEHKNRDFSNRWYGVTNPNRLDDKNPIMASPEQFFSRENLGSEKLYYGDGTNYADKYTAQNLLTAGYAQIYYPLASKLFATAGLRGEYNHQQLKSRSLSGGEIIVNNPIFNPLPSVNIAYRFAPKQTLRLAYSQTLNRPEFRELAPFTYYDFVYDVTRIGYVPKHEGDKLQHAAVHNYDLRYEFYPSESEFITVALFDKEFKNAIENAIRYDGSGIAFTVAKAPKAYSRGVEVEVRKTMTGFNSRVLDDVTLIFNGALIQSDVVTGTAGNVASRSLQGQSPYLVNLGVFYNGKKNGWQANALYNVIGKRIFVIGDNQLSANVYEMPRHVIDLNLSKQISARIQLRLTIQDLLNQPFRLMQDTNRDKKITSEDGAYQYFQRGSYTTIGINYNLY